MANVKPRYPLEEFARRGKEIYESKIRRTLSKKDHGKFVAIDIETGEYEMDADELSSSSTLRKRVPEAQIWFVRVGYRAARNLGGGRRRSDT